MVQENIKQILNTVSVFNNKRNSFRKHKNGDKRDKSDLIVAIFPYF